MQTVQLVNFGKVIAHEASELREGDLRMFNSGCLALVIKVIEKTAKTLSVITYSFESEQYFMTDIRKNSLIAIADRNQDISNHKPIEVINVRNNKLVNVSKYFI